MCYFIAEELVNIIAVIVFAAAATAVAFIKKLRRTVRKASADKI